MAQLPEASTSAPFGQAPDLARGDDLPLGAQLAWRLRVLIASGQLAPGDRLAGEAVEGARENGVDPRDLARAIYSASSGSYVLDAEFVEPTGIPQTEVPDVGTDERAGRQELRRQIARLEAQLASYPADSRKPGEPTHPLLRPKGHVPDMAELEQIRDDLIERLNRARAAAERRGDRQRRARTRLEEMTVDPAAHKWETVASDDLGEPGCGTWEVQPKWGPVGALMNWWRVKVSSGCPLPAPREAAIGRRR